MGLINVSDEMMRNTVREIVAERPEHVYLAPGQIAPGDGYCLYVHEDPATGAEVPGCLIGHAFHRLGVPLAAMRSHEGDSAYAVARYLIAGISDDTRHYLGRAQEAQDAGKSWAVALCAAERVPAGVEF